MVSEEIWYHDQIIGFAHCKRILTSFYNQVRHSRISALIPAFFVMLLIRTSGVLPMLCRMFGIIFGGHVLKIVKHKLNSHSHQANAENQSESDRLWKVGFTSNHLNENFDFVWCKW